MEVKGLESPVQTKDTKRTSGAMVNTVRRGTLLTHTQKTSPKTTLTRRELVQRMEHQMLSVARMGFAPRDVISQFTN